MIFKNFRRNTPRAIVVETIQEFIDNSGCHVEEKGVFSYLPMTSFGVARFPNLEEKRKFKIWLAGEVIYLFGSGQDGVYNESSDKYEHTGQYQLHMNRTANGVFLTVKTPEGLSAPVVVADELLWGIKEQL